METYRLRIPMLGVVAKWFTSPGSFSGDIVMDDPIRGLNVGSGGGRIGPYLKSGGNLDGEKNCGAVHPTGRVCLVSSSIWLICSCIAMFSVRSTTKLEDFLSGGAGIKFYRKVSTVYLLSILKKVFSNAHCSCIAMFSVRSTT